MCPSPYLLCITPSYVTRRNPLIPRQRRMVGPHIELYCPWLIPPLPELLSSLSLSASLRQVKHSRSTVIALYVRIYIYIILGAAVGRADGAATYLRLSSHVHISVTRSHLCHTCTARQPVSLTHVTLTHTRTPSLWARTAPRSAHITLSGARGRSASAPRSNNIRITRAVTAT